MAKEKAILMFETLDTGKQMKLRINFKDNFQGEYITSHTIDREIVKKEESIYGVYYTLKCGWYVDYNNHHKRWEITTLKNGEYIGRFNKEDIKEIIINN